MPSLRPLVEGSGLYHTVHALYQDAPLGVAPLLEYSHSLLHCSGYCYTFLEKIAKTGLNLNWSSRKILEIPEV